MIIGPLLKFHGTRDILRFLGVWNCSQSRSGANSRSVVCSLVIVTLRAYQMQTILATGRHANRSMSCTGDSCQKSSD